MRVRFLTRNVKLDEDLKEYMEKKLTKIERFFDRIVDTQVALDFKRGMNSVEITSDVNGVFMRGENYSPDLRTAFDKALKNIEKQVRRQKDYLTDKGRLKIRDISFDIDPALKFVKEDENDSKKILKVKQFDVQAMSPEEATMQMDLLGHSFFIFRDGESGDINVVYKRDAGGYGLLEPK